MSQFELIDDYLANRLSDGAKVEFEKQMEGDPQLKTEVEFQKQIIEGIKKARVTELKSMLNNVPVGGGVLSTGKVALATLSAGIVGTLLYFTLQSSQVTNQSTTEEVITEQPVEASKENSESEKANSEDITNQPTQQTITEIKEAPKANNKTKTNTTTDSPKVEVMDLTNELTSEANESIETATNTKSVVSPSTMDVETVSGDKLYPFHYQFVSGKLVLYGPFDSNLYEIIEVNGAHHSVFLYYKDGYYSLNEAADTIVPLILIRDDELLSRLKKYRSNK